MKHVEQNQPLASGGGEDSEAPTDAGSMRKATARARAFAAEWLAQRARMERAVAEYEALKAMQSPDRNSAVQEGPSN